MAETRPRRPAHCAALRVESSQRRRRGDRPADQYDPHDHRLQQLVSGNRLQLHPAHIADWRWRPDLTTSAAMIAPQLLGDGTWTLVADPAGQGVFVARPADPTATISPGATLSMVLRASTSTAPGSGEHPDRRVGRAATKPGLPALRKDLRILRTPMDLSSIELRVAPWSVVCSDPASASDPRNRPPRVAALDVSLVNAARPMWRCKGSQSSSPFQTVRPHRNRRSCSPTLKTRQAPRLPVVLRPRQPALWDVAPGPGMLLRHHGCGRNHHVGGIGRAAGERCEHVSPSRSPRCQSPPPGDRVHPGRDHRRRRNDSRGRGERGEVRQVRDRARGHGGAVSRAVQRSRQCRRPSPHTAPTGDASAHRLERQ